MKKSRRKKREIDEWRRCYPSNWKGLIIPEAMSHPAKYSSKLIRRIYQHMLEEDWIKPGDSVLDPFGGVSLGALDAMRLGLHWYGGELEAKFHKLGNENIALWNSRFGSMPNWGSAELRQGDSRKLLEVLGIQATGAVSSPPYADGSQHTGGDDPHPERLQGGKYHGVGLVGAISSPPYAETINSQTNGIDWNKAGRPDRTKPSAKRISPGVDGGLEYGNTLGQLGAMKADGFEAAVSSLPYNPPMSQDHNGKRGGKRGVTPSESGAFVRYGNTEGQLEGMNMDGFQASISSPPFLQSEGGTPEPKPGGSIDQALYARHAAGNKSANGYGTTEGQLSSMKEGGFDAAVSSPPFLNETKGSGLNVDKPDTFRGVLKDGSLSMGDSDGQLSKMPSAQFDASVSSPPYNETDQNYRGGWERFHKNHDPLHANNIQREAEYGSTDGQLSQADDFWLAARSIVEQVYIALQPGGHAVWIVKDYVKAKKIVPFSDQWRQLCEAVGFVTLHEHRAMLVHHKGTQHTLDGGIVEYRTESKSFFRRVAEKKGSPRIDWETVFCMVKEGN